MDDIVKRLRDQGKDAFARHYSLGVFKLCDEAATEIERLRAAFLACLQAENECATRGRICEPADTCGCVLEMEDYIDAALRRS
jgi:hypothetical protein